MYTAPSARLFSLVTLALLWGCASDKGGADDTGADGLSGEWTPRLSGAVGLSLDTWSDGGLLAGLDLSEPVTLDNGQTYASSLGEELVVAWEDDGSVRWALQLTPTLGDEGSASLTRAVALADGGAVLAGWTDQALELGGLGIEAPESEALWWAEVDASGEVSWFEHLALATYEHDEDVGTTAGEVDLSDLAAHPDGSLTVVGSFIEDLHLGDDDTLAWEDVRRCNGDMGSPCPTSFLAHYDPDGTLAWTSLIGGDRERRTRSLAALPDGGVALAAEFFETVVLARDQASERELVSLTDNQQYTDVLVAAWDADGELSWARHLADAGRNHTCGIAVDDSGRVLAAGSFWADAFTVGLDDSADALTLVAAEEGTRGWLARFDSDGSVDTAIATGGRYQGAAFTRRCLAVDGDAPSLLWSYGGSGLVFPADNGGSPTTSASGNVLASYDGDLGLDGVIDVSEAADSSPTVVGHDLLPLGEGTWIAGTFYEPGTGEPGGIVKVP